MNSGTVLKRGDNDDRNVWGGSKQTTSPAYTVRLLQADLKAIGVYSDTIDGGFGKNTERAVKIFQWCLKNSIQVVKNSALITYTPTPTTMLSGKHDSSTATKLSNWITNKYLVTGDLVRISTPNLSNIELSSGFKHIGKPIVSKTELVISKAAFPLIQLMNKSANSLKLTIYINQALRLHGVKVTGSVVPPASKSQHLIGHAIDCNIVDGSSWNTSKDFKKKNQTANADKFIKAIKKGLYRWGGDFSQIDTPHFDKQLNANTFDYDAKFFLNQKQLSSGDPIEKQLIP
ncbi:MAG: M15 family metallopeptidase [Gammaproteobacteria bacterium]|nr:M15 family metallopeptidase [Gammaproteobacteria bacterium]